MRKPSRKIKKCVSDVKKQIYGHLTSLHTRHVRIIGGVSIALFAVVMVGFYGFVQPPRDFPVGTLISVPKGASVAEIGRILAEEDVIKSAETFTTLAQLPGMSNGSILFGEYYFETPQNVWEVVTRMTAGEFGLDPVRITIPEGATAAEIALILDDRMPSFPLARFQKIVAEKEGYLFPDTYFFLPNTKPKHIAHAMEENFHQKTREIKEQLEKEERTLEEIVIMASIIEKEAIIPEDKRLVSGILWKRMEIGMPLQVDAPFIYGIGKNTFQLTYDDLETDSPYNTYTNRGLPPTAIANPGMESIHAAFKPEESPYLYFLSDLRSNMHYAEDFEEHKRNKRLYLN